MFGTKRRKKMKIVDYGKLSPEQIAILIAVLNNILENVLTAEEAKKIVKGYLRR
jgi:hypothetical protein